MELQFQNSQQNYLRTITRQKQPVEQTQELRLSDGMPDIGQVLGCWGQVILRSKHWNSNSIGITAGVMVWMLYAPEEGNCPCVMETWIPFQQKFELSETSGREGTIHCDFQLTAVDVRNTSARKLFVRVCVDTTMETYLEDRMQVYMPDDVPVDVQLLQNTYPILIAVEAGEKPFELEEMLRLPESCPTLRQLVYCKIYPKVQEKKMVGDKLIFRGTTLVHLLYLADDEMLYSWDFDVPFSQYAELEREYEPDVGSNVRMILTSQELQPDEQGALRLQFGLTGQYEICQRTMIPVVEDAYSTVREIQPQKETLLLSTILDRQEQRIVAQQVWQTDGLRVADAAFVCHGGALQHNGDKVHMELSGQFHMLCYDLERKLVPQIVRWEQPWSIPADENTRLNIRVCNEPTQALLTAGGVNAENELILDITAECTQPLEMIVGMEFGENLKSEKEKPSLILCKAGKNGLWSVAKSAGSTISAIQKANRLEEEPDENRILLIPIR